MFPGRWSVAILFRQLGLTRLTRMRPLILLSVSLFAIGIGSDADAENRVAALVCQMS